MRTALIVVDVQNDFCPGGALAVEHGADVVNVINRLMEDNRYDYVVATLDWHPLNHKSFAVNHPGKKIGDVVLLNGSSQMLWPIHCVEETPGAALHSRLDLQRIDSFIKKGQDPEVDSYSGFFDNASAHATGLGSLLKEHAIGAVVVVGLALDYCVAATAFDAKTLGFDVTVTPAATRAVNVRPGDDVKCIETLRSAGIRII